MKQRPRLLVFLAVFYLLSPILYQALVSVYFGAPFLEVLQQTAAENSSWRNFEIFILPLLLATCIFVARRLGYFIVILGSLYLCTRSLTIFLSANETVPTSVLVFTNIIFVGTVFYLLRKKTRAIYFNPKIRWWETEARYIVNLKASMIRLGAEPTPVLVSDIAMGGAAIETSDVNFLPHEMIRIEFEHAGVHYKNTAGVVWERQLSEGKRLLGTQWIVEGARSDRPSMSKLIKELRAAGTPKTGQPPGWWEELKSWAVKN